MILVLLIHIAAAPPPPDLQILVIIAWCPPRGCVGLPPRRERQLALSVGSLRRVAGAARPLALRRLPMPDLPAGLRSVMSSITLEGLSFA